MDKLKTKILLILLISILVISVQSIAAAEISDANDDIIDLSNEIETVDVETANQDIASENLAIDESNEIESLSADSSVDESDEIKSPSTEEKLTDGNAGDLQDLIDDDDDGYVELNQDYTWETGDPTVNIRKKITINGNGHKINGSAINTKILISCSDTVIFKNITFINAGTCALQINASSQNSIIENCIFANSTLNSYSKPNVMVQWNGANGTVDNCKFINISTSTTQKGNALYWNGANGTIKNSIFEDNYCMWRGGAIYVENEGLKVLYCNFTNNTAQSFYGGAIFADKTANRLNISNCNFDKNKANTRKGGAIYMNSSDSIVDNCNFTDSIFGEDAGGIYIGGSNNTVKNSNFTNANASTPWGGSKRGGGIFINGSENTVDNCYFGDNHGNYGAGVFEDGGSLNVIKNCVFNENRVQGLYIRGEHTNVSNCNFTNNGISSGSAIMVGSYAIDPNIEYSNFKDNNGSAIFLFRRADISHCNFTGNNDSSGGAVDVSEYAGDKDNPTVISDCIFKDNTAVSPYGDLCLGSAIYAQRVYLTVKDSIILENLAQARYLSLDINYDSDNNVYFNTTFIGMDNVINGIFYSALGSQEELEDAIYLINVTYHGANGETTTPSSLTPYPWSDYTLYEIAYGKPYYGLEAGINITLCICDKDGNSIKNITSMSDWFGNNTYANLGLAPGEYKAYAIHKEDKYYTEIQSNVIEFTIDPFETEVSSIYIEGKVSEKVNITFNVTYKVNGESLPVKNGTLNFTTHDGKKYSVEVKDGKAIFTDYILPLPGEYSYDVEYQGNDYYTPSYGKLDLHVAPLDVIITLDEITNYTGAVVKVVVLVKDEFGNDVQNGTLTFTIDYGNKISNVKMASADIKTANVSQGKATFVVTLGDSGVYPSKAEYSPVEGDNYYNPSESESRVNVLKLDTTIKSDDVSGNKGDTVDITADITDNNGKPVKNGTAVLTINGKEYTAEVKDGKATFTNVELPSESTTATINYLGNDYYNPSNTTIDININEEPSNETQPNDEPTDEPTEEPSEEPSDEPTEEPSSEPNSVATKTVAGVKGPVAGNPIAMLLLVLMALVSSISIRRQK